MRPSLSSLICAMRCDPIIKIRRVEDGLKFVNKHVEIARALVAARLKIPQRRIGKALPIRGN